MAKAYFTILAFICSCWLPVFVVAQFGISFQQHKWQADAWEQLTQLNDSLEIADNNLQFGLSYWLRLKNTRIEFHPGIAYTFSIDKRLSAYELQRTAWIGQLGAGIYPFVLKGDCDCPTFSKQGNFFQKGLFIEITPGVEYQINKVLARDSDQSSLTELQSKGLSFRLGGAVGLDFGVSDLITLTPSFNFVWVPNAEWTELKERFAPDSGTGLEQSDIIAYGFGLRLLFRPDYRKPGF